MSAKAPAAGRTVTAADNRKPTDQVMREKHPKIFARLTEWLAKAEKAAKRAPKSLKDCEALEALYLEGREIRNDADTVRTQEGAEPFKLYSEINATFNGGVRDVVGSESGKPGLANGLKDTAAAFRLAETRKAQQLANEQAAAIKAKSDELAEQAAATAGRGEHRIAEAQAAGAAAVGTEADRLASFAAKPVSEASKVTVGGVSASVNAKLVCIAVNRAELDLAALLPYLADDVLIDAINACLKLTSAKAFKGAVLEEKAIGSIRRA